MRKLKIIEHISLDGVIPHSADDDDFPYTDWSTPYRTPAPGMQYWPGETFDLLLGRRTYDGWSSFWPKAPSSPMADRLNAATKIRTHRPESLEWGPAESLGVCVEGIRRIKSRDGPHIILSGSAADLDVLEHGLADEVLLVVYPLLLWARGSASLRREPRRVSKGTKHGRPRIIVSSYQPWAAENGIGSGRNRPAV